MLTPSLGKTFFAWRFILNENLDFLLTMSYQKLFVFSLSLLCFQVFIVKLILGPKTGLTYAISIVNCLLEILLENISCFSSDANRSGSTFFAKAGHI